MNIKAGIVKIVLEKKISFFNKTEFFAEREIRKGVIDQKQTKSGNRNPEKHLEKDLHRSLKGE
jgi:hypothetical protein